MNTQLDDKLETLRQLASPVVRDSMDKREYERIVDNTLAQIKKMLSVDIAQPNLVLFNG